MPRLTRKIKELTLLDFVRTSLNVVFILLYNFLELVDRGESRHEAEVEHRGCVQNVGSLFFLLAATIVFSNVDLKPAYLYPLKYPYKFFYDTLALVGFTNISLNYVWSELRELGDLIDESICDVYDSLPTWFSLERFENDADLTLTDLMAVVLLVAVLNGFGFLSAISLFFQRFFGELHSAIVESAPDDRPLRNGPSESTLCS